MNLNNQPLFASSSGGGQSDDFDLGEVFAEYFSNEFDLDPLNAYTSTMGNFSGTVQSGVPTMPTAAQAHAAATAAQQAAPATLQSKDTSAAVATTTTTANAASNGGLVAPSSSMPETASSTAAAAPSGEGGPLPTGGIKTAFHIGSSVPSRPTGVIVPPQKKAKSEPAQAPIPQQQQQPVPVAPNLLAPNNAMGGPVAALALAHQQAASAAVVQQQQQQLAVVAQQGGIPTPQALQQQQQLANSLVAAGQANAAAAAAAAAGGQAAAAAGGQVPLPVGVGIRMGGMGGIAPSTAQATVRPPTVQTQYAAAAMWGGQHPGAALMSMAPPGATTEQAVAERRQRNREHAKRSRVRKKFMLESMQEQVRSLQLENQNLRLLVQEHIPEHAVSIISDCCSSSPLFSEGELGADNSNTDDPTKLGKSDFSLMESLTAGQKCFVLSDPKLPDNPIVYASPGFYEMTGYTAKEVLGRNCRFLQGPGTDPRAVDVIRKAISTGADATVCLLNYKADGTPFWNQFFIAALRDSDNCIVNYVGAQCEVEPEQGDSAVEEKVNEVLPLAMKGDEKEEEE